MSASSPTGARTDGSPQTEDAPSELDVYAAEFAKLVDHYTPTRGQDPSMWLRQLPNEAFRYFQQGIATFGDAAETPLERRGRLYLMHTALLFMWMDEGRQWAREQFRAYPRKGTRRAASLVMLEHYRRGGVLAQYDVLNWFLQPVEHWRTTLITRAVRIHSVPDHALKRDLRQTDVLQCRMAVLSTLRAAQAVPPLRALPLG